MTRRLSEILTGAAVILVAALFLFFALGRAHTSTGGGYTLHAQFDHVDGLSIGAPVKMAGVQVGTVTSASLDPKTYAALVDFTVRDNIQVPSDSSAAILSESLLGGDYLSISPGGSPDMLKQGGAITVTQSSINLETLLGKFIFSAANLATAKPSAAAPSSPAAAPANPLAPPVKAQ
ncbi:MAG: outer membrane lipid asymmetry maintenance protein MlaD [Rhodospirillales bacterium 20-60-12]|nr:MAG: outer membrane lipid asymmetry maintenance protein MlaD [Rhodospirillales bacterium 20-60-12]HQT66301.1 outer membrane lipid asymmetry maintenance protein MlaD [Acetobacteraceae bacterium]